MVDTSIWIASFKEAIQFHDADYIRDLLQNLPYSKDMDVMKQILLLTMDAEIMLCEMRKELVNERDAILSQL